MSVETPYPGQIAFVRQRRYLVESVAVPSDAGDSTLVELSCLDDDAQGQPLIVLWENELDARLLKDDGWAAVAERGFDDPELFAAYLRTLSWNCVTATDPDLFQSPFRAGIRLDAYQLEPLRKALRLPRVNLFIADDVGLGKTIEAGLIARELLLRRRIDRIVVACPPSMLEQWRDEMETRFGLRFVVLDRAYVAQMRRERGFSVNPWTTHSHFLVSHRLLIDEAYASGLRDWLGEFAPKSLFVLDEAHNVAPSSGSRYAIDSQLTRAIRDIAPRFEHRLFLSATPHNGHSNSFSALLEILDPQRFCRGVPVSPEQLEEIMVRRLKSDIRELEGGFPKRSIVQIDIDGLPDDSPELVLAEKLDRYRYERDKRLAGATRSQQTVAALVTGCLQKRLLSSIEAFARTLHVHRRSVKRAVEEAAAAVTMSPLQIDDLKRLTLEADDTSSDSIDSENAFNEDDTVSTLEQPNLIASELDMRMMAATAASSDASNSPGLNALQNELELVDEMLCIAEASRYERDARVVKLLEWIEKNMCPDLLSGCSSAPRWNDRRVIIFTEYEATRRYLEQRLNEAISHTDEGERRTATFTGSTSSQRREEIKHIFNTEPKNDPLRILIATDAAREGLNLQRHCHDLFHFDLPWNPGRLDQRNGRIDRKLQPAEEVSCYYFVYGQRPEDRVLQVLVRKSERIREEMGSVANVLDGRVAENIGRSGMRRDDLDELADFIENAELEGRRTVVEDELESTRSRQDKLKGEVEGLRTRLQRSRQRIGITAPQFRQTLSMSLRLSGAPDIESSVSVSGIDQETPETFIFPADSDKLARDFGWATALDTLRDRRQRGESLSQWRERAEVRPIVFEDSGRLGENAVHMHLEHRVAQRLLGRFTSQGLIHHDLSKACLTAGPDSVSRVVLLGRLSVYGPGAARLHEEVVPIAARWFEPSRRNGPLTPYGRRTEQSTLSSLQEALDNAGRYKIAEQVQARIAASAQRDIDDLLPHLESRCEALLEEAKNLLSERAVEESLSMTELLKSQRERIRSEFNSEGRQLTLGFTRDELRQHEADRRAWQRRLDDIETELESEPRRIAESYTVQAHRVDPLGLVYLWPRTG